MRIVKVDFFDVTVTTLTYKKKVLNYKEKGQIITNNYSTFYFFFLP